MRTLGISGSERSAAAAVSVDGCVVAAATEDVFARVCDIGYRATSGWPAAAVEACLGRAGLAPGDIDRLAVVDDHDCLDGESMMSRSSVAVPKTIRADRVAVERCRADARQIMATGQSDEALLFVIGFQPGSHAVFRQRGSDLTALAGLCGADALVSALRGVAEAVGVSSLDSFAVARPGAGEIPAPLAGELDLAIRWVADSRIAVDQSRLLEVLRGLDALGASVEDRLLNARFHHQSRAVAAAFWARLEALVVEIADTLRQRHGVSRVGFGGALFSSPAVVSAVVRAFGSDAVVAPVPGTAGRAIGAALEDAAAPPRPLCTLSLGPAFSEEEVKNTLDNCRLGYVYEPEWPRLLERVSRLLARGTLVAWFQGPMGFGPRAVGARTILCDPSNHWARENVNRFLRQIPIDTPLPLAIVKGTEPRCIDVHARPFAVQDSVIPAEWRNRVVAALDRQDTAQLQVLTNDDGVQLCNLLRLHHARTRVPGLITSPFSGPGEPTVCTPRDAIRTMFSSPVDVLIIERFVVAKDYWLLTSNVD